MSKPIFWIYGNHRQSKQSWDQIVEHVRKFGEEPNINTLYCGTNTAKGAAKWATSADVIHLLRNKDMFDDRPRIIKVYGLSPDYTEIVDWLHLVDGNNILVFYGPAGYTKSGSKQWVSAKTSKLYKLIKSKGRVIEHKTEVRSESEAVSWIKQIAADCKKEMSSSAAKKMVQLQGKNLDILANSTEKVCLYQTRKKIEVEDVEACCFSDYSDEVWTFLSDLNKKNVARSLEYLQNFYAEGDGSTGEGFYGRVNKLFGALMQHYQFLMMLKDVCGSSMNLKLLEKEMLNFRKITPTNIQELREGKIKIDDLDSRFSSKYVENKVRDQSIQQVLSRKKSEIYRILTNLYDCMYWCRRYSSDPYLLRLCLDTFVLVACGRMSSFNALRIRHP